MLPRHIVVALLLLLAPNLAWAQNKPVFQSGLNITRGHAAVWQNNGVIADAGGANGSGILGSGYLTELGITNTGTPFCIDDALTSAVGGYHQLCLGANALGGGLISYNNFGAAVPLPLQFSINGSLSQYPPVGGPGNVVGPLSSAVGNLPTFNNGTGNLLKDSGIGSGAIPAKRIIAYPPTTWTASASNPWIFVVPEGYAPIVTAGTQSQGFAEAFAYRALNGLSMDIYGPGENQLGGGGGSTVYPYISSAVGLDTGPLVQTYIKAHGVNVTFGSVVTGCGFKINTMLDGGAFEWPGQIVYTNTVPSASSAAVCLAPTDLAPVEGFAGIFNSRIIIGGVAANTASVTPKGAVVLVNTANNVLSNDIYIGEINCNGPGGGADLATGMNITGATAVTGFASNKVRIGALHQCLNGIVVGSAGNAGNYRANQFDIGLASLNNPTNATGIVFDDFGTGNFPVNISEANSNEGAYNLAFKLEATSSGDHIEVSAAGYGDATGWSDLGTNSLIRFNGSIINAGTVSQTAATNFSNHVNLNSAESVGGAAPTVTLCTGGSVLNGGGYVSGSNKGYINIASTPSTCTLNFTTFFQQGIPVCHLSSNQLGHVIAGTPSVSSVVIVPVLTSTGNATTFANGELVAYMCF